MSTLAVPAQPAYTAHDRRRRIFAIVAASSGNLVEWFDFYVYAFCAIYFAPVFFPKSDPTAQLLNTAGVFAAGLLMRPIGGWLFGRFADRHGRKSSLVLPVTMMCDGSLLIACLPPYLRGCSSTLWGASLRNVWRRELHEIHFFRRSCQREAEFFIEVTSVV